METRCQRGAEIAAKLRFGPAVQDGIRALDEHWNGGGKPLGLKETAIPMAANIALLAQVVDIFHTAEGAPAALREIESRSGTWFNPDLVAAFAALSADGAFWRTLKRPDIDQIVFALPPGQKPTKVTEGYLDDITAAFASVIDAKSPFTADHSARVTLYTDTIAEQLGLDQAHRRWLRRAALLHDLGKLAVSNQVLDKPSKLDDDEWQAIRAHSRHSEEILTRVSAFHDIAPIAGAHHERLDGHGYPYGLKGDQIGLEVRILTVADVFDALSAERPYRAAIPIDEVFKIMERDIGTAFDATCIDALKRGMQAMNARAA
jgi:putative nucleotidyltransferase with HDIG domain